MVVGLPIGVWLDRTRSAKRTIVGANLAQGAITAAVAVCIWIVLQERLSENLGVVVLLAAMFVLGTAEIARDVSAQVLLPRLVERNDLPEANGKLGSVELATNNFAGTPLAAPLLAFFPPLAFALNSVSFFFSSIVVSKIETVEEKKSYSPSSRREGLTKGFKVLWNEPVVRDLTYLLSGFNLGLGAVLGVFVLYVQNVLLGSAWTLSALMMAAAAGGIVAGWSLGWVVRTIGRNRTLVICLGVAALTFAVMGLIHHVVVAVLAYAIYGLVVIPLSMISRTERQIRIRPDEYARSTTAHRFITFGALLIGNLLGGLIARYLGPSLGYSLALSVPFLFASLTVSVSALLILPRLFRGLRVPNEEA